MPVPGSHGADVPPAAALDLRDLPNLGASRERALATCAEFAATLADALGAEPGVVAVAAAGSLGRLEIASDSDLDGIVVIADALDEAAADELAARVYGALANGPLRLPKAAGIFRSPVRAATLCDPAVRGVLDEAPAVFGKRIQCLLDARALHGATAFAALQRRILEWYAGPVLGVAPQAQFTPLLNDLQRYVHAYAGWQHYKLERGTDDGWYLRQAKLRTSRVLTFAGLLLLLGESSRRCDKLDWLHAHLGLTPLERVQAVMSAHDPAAFRRLAATYEAAHALLADPGRRAALVAASPTDPAGLARPHPACFAEIHRLGGELMRGLTRFVLERRDDWDPDFFAYLLL